MNNSPNTTLILIPGLAVLAILCVLMVIVLQPKVAAASTLSSSYNLSGDLTITYVSDCSSNQPSNICVAISENNTAFLTAYIELNHIKNGHWAGSIRIKHESLSCEKTYCASVGGLVTVVCRHHAYDGAQGDRNGCICDYCGAQKLHDYKCSNSLFLDAGCYITLTCEDCSNDENVYVPTWTYEDLILDMETSDEWNALLDTFDWYSVYCPDLFNRIEGMTWDDYICEYYGDYLETHVRDAITQYTNYLQPSYQSDTVIYGTIEILDIETYDQNGFEMASACWNSGTIIYPTGCGRYVTIWYDDGTTFSFDRGEE